LMNLVGKEQGLFSDEELTTLDGIGNQVAMALERAELIQNLEKKVDERTNDIQLLEEVAMAANECSKLEDAMRAALKLICVRLGWLVGHVYLPANDGTRELESKGLWHLSDDEKIQKFRMVTDVTRCAPGVGLPGRVMISKKPEWVADITQDPNFSRAEIPQDIVIRAGFATPVMMGQEAVGVLEAFSDRPIDCDQHVLNLMSQVGTELGRVAEREKGEQAVRHMVYYDPLTELPNRLFLREHLKLALASAAEERGTMALLLLDLDRFKDINDTLGHHHGDLLLQEAAKRLKDALPEASVVARLGGDEFAVLVPDARIIEGIQCSRKILRAFQKPFVLQGLSLVAKTSIGIALYPDHGQDGDLLYQRADVAMYVAKNSHSGYAVYDAKKDQYSPRHLVLMSELQEAIASDQLMLFYQPKIDLHTNQVTGVEALVRWQHPKLGLITPDQFLPLAERTGLMAPLTNCVIREALIQCHIWAGYGIKIKTSVNLSTDLVQDSDFLAQIMPLLKTMGVPAETLMFEITESAIMADPERALQNLSHMRSLGLSFSIDDFGTGYSSLAYLKNLPVEELKIDKSFTQNMLSNDKDLAIVRSTIELSHNLGLKVVAEGVETRRILESLAALGCDGAQGYYICHPIPGVKIPDWLKGSSWSLETCAL
jgi:diguanylate cyclase (GGDEF)-like protein